MLHLPRLRSPFLGLARILRSSFSFSRPSSFMRGGSPFGIWRLFGKVTPVPPMTPVTPKVNEADLKARAQKEARALRASFLAHLPYQAIKKCPDFQKFIKNVKGMPLGVFGPAIARADRTSDTGMTYWAPLSDKGVVARMDVASEHYCDDKGNVTINVLAQGTDKKLFEHFKLDLEKHGPAATTYPRYERSFLIFLLEEMRAAKENLEKQGKDVNSIKVMFSGHSLGASLSQLFMSSVIKVLHGKHVPGSEYENLLTGEGTSGAHELFTKINALEMNLSNSPGIPAQAAKKAENDFIKVKEVLGDKIKWIMTVNHVRHDIVQRLAGEKILGANFTKEQGDNLLVKYSVTKADARCKSRRFLQILPWNMLSKANECHSFKPHEQQAAKTTCHTNADEEGRRYIERTLNNKTPVPSLLPPFSRQIHTHR